MGMSSRSPVARHDARRPDLFARPRVRVDHVHAGPPSEPARQLGLPDEDRLALRAVGLLDPDLLPLVEWLLHGRILAAGRAAVDGACTRKAFFTSEHEPHRVMNERGPGSGP